MKGTITEAGKEDIALALILLKDFKSGGKFNAALTINMLRLAEHLEVKEQYEKLMSKIPPMRIEPR